MNERLIQTVKIDDLDKKMHDMVSREEFNSFALDVKHAAEKEKNILSSKIDTLQIENVSLKQRLDDLESKLDSTEKCA